MEFSEPVNNALQSELLCIADSNWVLGHWYTVCMLNGRELTDFTSMAGIAEEKLGHTRALFRFMEESWGLPEFQLEFGRDVQAVHAMALLDRPPRNWADFMLTLYLADVALWRFSNTLREGSFAPVAGLITRFGEEAYFHQLCLDGWLKALTDAERELLSEALPARLDAAQTWFQQEGDDPLLDAGIRTQSIADAGARFAEDVRNRLTQLVSLEGVPDGTSRPAKWDYRRRRPQGSALPPRLWEAIVPTSEEAQLARRPLAVSVDDNIDLFGKIRKDQTEPQF